MTQSSRTAPGEQRTSAVLGPMTASLVGQSSSAAQLRPSCLQRCCSFQERHGSRKARRRSLGSSASIWSFLSKIRPLSLSFYSSPFPSSKKDHGKKLENFTGSGRLL